MPHVVCESKWVTQCDTWFPTVFICFPKHLTFKIQRFGTTVEIEKKGNSKEESSEYSEQMAALLNTGPPRVTKFEGDHIPLTGVMLVLECLIK